jgi:hypothetical protein
VQTLDILRFRDALEQEGEYRQRITYSELLKMCRER